MDTSAIYSTGTSGSSMNSSSRDCPPSLYDTSVSSASGGGTRSSVTTTSQSNRGGMMSSRLPLHQHQHQNHNSPQTTTTTTTPFSPSSRFHQSPRQQRQQPQQSRNQHPVVSYPSPKYSRSMDYGDYYSSRTATISDPGGPTFNINNNNSRNNTSSNNHRHPKIEYAQSDIGLPSTTTASPPRRPYNITSAAAASAAALVERARTATTSTTTSNSNGGRYSYDNSSSTYRYNGSSGGSSPRYSEQIIQQRPRTTLEPSPQTNNNNSLQQQQQSKIPNPLLNDSIEDSNITGSSRVETPSPTPVNVKELKRQLWNDNEELQLSKSEHRRRSTSKEYSSDSEQQYFDRRRQIQQQQQQQQQQQSSPSRPTTTTTAAAAAGAGPSSPLSSSQYYNTRFARSLSPARRQQQHQQSNQGPISQQQQAPQPPGVQYAPSTISDTSSGGRFHSKFYEAALVARMRGKVVPPSPSSFSSGGGGSGNNTRQQQQQQQQQQPYEVTSPSSSARMHNESLEQPPSIQRVASSSTDKDDIRGRGNENRTNHWHQQQQYPPPDNSDHHRPPVQRRQSYQEEHEISHSMERNSDQFQHKRSSSMNQYRQGHVDGSPTTLNEEQQNQRSNRGRSAEPPRRDAGGGGGRGRVPSPLIQERIRSFSQGPPPTRSSTNHRSQINDSTGERTATESPINDPRNESFHATIGLYGSEHGSRTNTLHGGTGTKNINGITTRSEQVAAYWQQRTTVSPNAPTSRDNPGDYSQQNKVPYDEQHHHPTSKTKKIIAPDSPGSSKAKMAYLMAQLHSVNRNNPEEALAQIDRILRHESLYDSSPSLDHFQHSSSDREADVQRSHLFGQDYSGYQKNDNGDDDDDDDSDVSSITNPTYQGPSSKPHNAHVQVVPTQSEILQPPTNQMGTVENNAASNLQSNPSTSSFRRPRPSHLQNYTMPTSTRDVKDPFTMSRSEFKRQQLKEYPPPGTINVKDNSLLEESIVPSLSPVEKAQEVLQKMDRPLYSNGTIGDPMSLERQKQAPPRNQNKAQPVETTRALTQRKQDRAGKLDKFITDKEALAQKIRVWDDMSRSKSEKVSEETQLIIPSQLPSPPNTSRRHPWDGKVPSTRENVQIRDTSMENTIGIETEMTVRAGSHNVGAVTYYSDKPKPSDSSDQMIPDGKPFDKSRDDIKKRSEGYLPVDPVYHVGDNRIVEKTEFPEIPLTKSTVNLSAYQIDDNSIADLSNNHNGESKEGEYKDSFPDLLMSNLSRSSEGAIQFNPFSSQKPQEKQNTGTDMTVASGNDGSSWVSLPSTSFFKEVNKKLNPFAESESPTNKSSTDSSPSNPFAESEPSPKKKYVPPTAASKSSINPFDENRSQPQSVSAPRSSSQFYHASEQKNMSQPGQVRPMNQEFSRKRTPVRTPTQQPKIQPTGDTRTPPVRTPVGHSTRQRVGTPKPVDMDDYVNSDSVREDRQALNQSAERAEIEVSLAEANKFLTDDDGVAISRTGAQSLVCQTGRGSTTRGKSKEKKRGFLRAFIEKKKKKASAASVGYAASATSVTGQSTSLESRGAKSLSYVDSAANRREQQQHRLVLCHRLFVSLHLLLV